MMAHGAPAAPKLQFIESLRGLAACQVLLLHYAAAFLPALARVPGEAHYAAEAWLTHTPLFLLLDGYSAVYLFFVMSGFVLAPSFVRAPQGWGGLLLKRYLRLFLPVLAAFCVAVLLWLALPHAKSDAAALSHSGWLAYMNRNPMSWSALFRDGLWSNMLAGYDHLSVFAPWPQLATWIGVGQLQEAMNSPMWTLHVEFWGSVLLIVVACACRRLPGALFWPLFAGLGWAAGSSQFLLFLVGFLLHHVRQTLMAPHRRGGAALGALLVAAGLYVCASKQVPGLSAAWRLLGHAGLLSADSDFHWQSQIGALLVFVGALLCAPLRAALDRPCLSWLGRVSFSTYLLHFPILVTVGCLVFARLAPYSYSLAFSASLVVGAGLTFVAAHWFERWVDRRAVAASRGMFMRP